MPIFTLNLCEHPDIWCYWPLEAPDHKELPIYGIFQDLTLSRLWTTLPRLHLSNGSLKSELPDGCSEVVHQWPQVSIYLRKEWTMLSLPLEKTLQAATSRLEVYIHFLDTVTALN
ncbi:hypothetical protein J6590_058565 [Homalodisca vitripennis]|nr:hypothetical protein J6590_058565 [Homalodisca vitripennis]